MRYPGKNIVHNLRESVRNRLEEMVEDAEPPRDDEELEDQHLSLEIFLRALPNLFGEADRRVWSGRHRTHVELGDVSSQDIDALADAIGEALTNHPAIALVDINTTSGRAIFEHPESGYGWKFFQNVLERSESATGIDSSMPHDRHDYPSDVEPITRRLVEVVTDLFAVSLAAYLKLTEFEPNRLEFDLSQITALVENTPRLRCWLERRLGKAAVDVGLGTVSSMAAAIGSGPVGPALDLVLQCLRLRGDLARRVLWLDREEQLCKELSLEDRAPSNRPSERPQPLPPGPIEEYADEALFASLGGFAIGLLDTESLEQSFTPLLGGLPKAARYGREAFLAELARVLAERGVVLMRSDVLDITDRVDAVVVDDRVFRDSNGAPDPHASHLVRSARQAGMYVVAVTTDAAFVERFDVDERIEVEANPWRDRAASETIRSLQKQGRVVAMVGIQSEAFADADLGIALDRAPAPSWNADVLATDLLDDASFILDACRLSRELSSESIVVAGTGAAIGTLLALGGLKKTDPGRVMTAVNAASVVALANGLRRARELERRPRPVTFEDTAWHAMEVEEVLERLGTTADGKERSTEVRESVEERGPEPWPIQLAHAVGKELVNPFTPILAGGAVLSALIGSLVDAAIVGGAVSLSALAGGIERFQTDRAIARLEKKERDPVMIVRGGTSERIDPGHLVVGDIICLEAGEVVPADCRIVRCRHLQVDESALTGESLTVHKTAEPVDADAVAERASMLFEGTSVASGEVRAVVVAVGAQTHSARAAHLAESSPDTGVESRLRELAEMTLPVAAASGALITSVGLAREQKMKTIIGSSIGLAVGAVPEGLPLLATVAQLAAARRLARRDIIVRNPRTIEALGRIDILCADKTGTLTEGRLRLHSISNGLDVGGDELASDRDARRVVAAALRATPGDGSAQELPHATDQAVVDGAWRLGIERTEGIENWEPGPRLPFGPDRPFHAVLGDADGQKIIAVKGAPETLVPRCTRRSDVDGGETPLDAADRRELLRDAEDLADQGLRVLCVAERQTDTETLGDETIRDLTFVGFVNLSDPIRETSAEAVERLHAAGIDTLMITGDHPRTALRIAKDAGLVSPDAGDEVIVNGDEMEQLTDDELAELLSRASVVARATPVHKVRIVRALQKAGRTVGMTGDGANDASAIRLADVGIALGAESTKAARHASDMIVLDSHLETIVEGIAEGRAIWGSVRDAVSILIGGNLGEIGFTVASSILSKEVALNTRQLLLVNLLTDIAPAIAIALRPPTDEETEQLLEEGLEYALGEALDEQITNRAVATSAGATAAWLVSRMLGGKRKASTVGLLAVVGAQLTQTLSAGENTRETVAAALGSAAVMLGIVQTPGLSQAFGCRPVGPIGLSIAAGASGVAASMAKLAPGALHRTRQWLEDKLELEKPEPTARSAPPEQSGLSPSWPLHDGEAEEG
jgi:cation-transporting ATPase I